MKHLAIGLLIFIVGLWLAFVVSGQAVDAIGHIYQNEEYGGRDEQQDWMMLFLGQLFDAQAERIEALQEDVREIRSQNAWILRILAGGSGVGVIGGGAAWRKRKKISEMWEKSVGK